MRVPRTNLDLWRGAFENFHPNTLECYQETVRPIVLFITSINNVDFHQELIGWIPLPVTSHVVV